MDGRAYTQSNEGTEPVSYWDTAHKRSVGVGFNLDGPGARAVFANLLPGVSFDDVYSGKLALSDGQVAALYSYTYARAGVGAARQVKDFASQPAEVQAVVTDMVFQMGEMGFAQFKRVRDALAAGDRAAAADNMVQSAWYVQTPNRAKLNVAVMRPAGKRSAAEAALAQKWVSAA